MTIKLHNETQSTFLMQKTSKPLYSLRLKVSKTAAILILCTASCSTQECVHDEVRTNVRILRLYKFSYQKCLELYSMIEKKRKAGSYIDLVPMI